MADPLVDTLKVAVHGAVCYAKAEDVAGVTMHGTREGATPERRYDECAYLTQVIAAAANILKGPMEIAPKIRLSWTRCNFISATSQ